MKKALTAIAIFLSAVSVTAQDIYDNPDNKAYFGIRASLDITCPGDITAKSGGVSTSVDLFKPGAGFSVGAIYNIPLYANLYFEPGLSLYYNTTGFDNITTIADNDIPGTIDASLREFGFRVPLMFGYHFDFAPCTVSIFTGPELSLGISGKEHYSIKSNGIKEKESTNMYDDFRRYDIGWRLGAGVSVDRYYLSVSGAFGMINRADQGDGVSWHQNNFALTLGYNF